jgi:replicative DNA helicase
MSDPIAERAILAGIMRYGIEAYLDVADIISVSSFMIDSNEVLFACIKHLADKRNVEVFDVPSIISVSTELGFGQFFSKKDELAHLSSINKLPVLQKNIRRFAAKIRKLEIARLMHDTLESTKDKYLDLTGDEPLAHILGIAEESIFDFTSLLSDTENVPTKLFHDIHERIEYLRQNVREQVGISTGYKRLDYAIGGGLRPGTVNVIGARPKVGKTILADNIGIYIARQFDIPVLNLDTEMRKEDHQDRSMAMLSHVRIHDIETGKFSKDVEDTQRLLDKAKEVKDVKYYYQNIGGMPFEDQLSIMRRWIAKEVGLNDQGKANQCVIIYDYIKLMTTNDFSKDLSEFQLLGFMMTSLHNFGLRYDVPFLAFIQLNRDGITKESSDTASGSDRIIWLCSNFTIYKRKSDDEIAMDGPKFGNRKLVPVLARHGEGLNDGEYINMIMRGAYGEIEETLTNFEITKQNQKTDEDVAF